MKINYQTTAYYSLVSAFLFVTTFSFGVTTSARVNKSNTKPLVLVLAVAKNAKSSNLERQFITQLALALDKFQVKTINSGLDNFSHLHFPQRLEKIKSLTKNFKVTATIWIENTEKGRTLLNLVALSTGRALVRIVEAKSGPDAALELALAAQELLGQAYLLTYNNRNNAVEDVVAKVTKDAVVTLKNPDAVLKDSKIQALSSIYPLVSISPFSVMRGGIFGHKGNHAMFGGGFAVEIWPIEPLLLRTSFAALSGLSQKKDWGFLSYFNLEPALGIGYLWRFKWLKIGPSIGTSLIWNKTDINLETGGNHSYSTWILRVDMAIDMRFILSEKLFVAIKPGFGFMHKKKRFHMDSSGSTLFMSPRMGWGLEIGLSVFF